MTATRSLAALLASIGIVLAPAMQAAVQAQDYPSGPIRVIAPGPPAAPRDIRARWLAEQLGPALGRPVVVENRAGAGGNIGMEAAAKSAPDGRTLVIVDTGTLVMNPHLYDRTGYDALRDFIPVARFVEAPLMLAVTAGLPVRSVADLIHLALLRPGQLSFGSPGVGTPPHLACELFRRMAGIEVVHVPYKGASFALTDLIAGRIDYTIDSLALQLPQVAAGKLRALAVTGAKRVAAAPDVPTMSEAGLPGYEFTSWMGVAMPAGTPAVVVARLNAELVRVLRTPGAAAWFAAQGGEVIADSPEAFAATVRVEHAKWRRIIHDAQIKAE
jgi:tripartite-type tricarboxylate transporter receptor subunit TctC